VLKVVILTLHQSNRASVAILGQGFLTWGASTPRGCWNKF